jgi:aryl-alcohol dehydrogenase-like predicted oxidoreductase
MHVLDLYGGIMKTRKLGTFDVAEVGYGCMSLSHAYGIPPDTATARATLLAAFDLGITHFDTAALYGFGRNEELVGAVLKPLRQRLHLASKCGITGVDGRRVVDGRPEVLERTCQQSLQRLQTDCIDLYYLHRWDKRVPIEDSVGALAKMVAAGWIRSIGLSEVSAATLRRAHAVHPIAAVQSEYSLWTRNPEIALLEACRELGVTLVAFSPLGRGFLAGAVTDPASLTAQDIRRTMPRFCEPHFAANLELLGRYARLAQSAGCTLPQLALAWLLQKSEHIVPIPGSTSSVHMAENVAATGVEIAPHVLQRLETLINSATVSGGRYSAQAQADVDTEEY